MKPRSKEGGVEYSLQRYILIGSSLGLYFGYFFRPSREPSLWIALGLSIVITVAMFFIRLFPKGRPPVLVALKEAPINFVQYFLVLTIFEGRHLAWGYGGRVATTILMTIMGAVTGGLFYWKSNRGVT